MNINDCLRLFFPFFRVALARLAFPFICVIAGDSVSTGVAESAKQIKNRTKNL